MIAEWLRGFGLTQYAPAFAVDAVRWDVLPKLTTADLREMDFNLVNDRSGNGGHTIPAHC